MPKTKIPNYRMAEIYRGNHERWKKYKLSEKGFFPVFNSFKDNYVLREVSGNALKLYLYLGLMSNNQSGETWVTIESAAAYFDKTPRTISNWVNELERKNLIRKLQLKPNSVAHTFLLPY